jgi:hypothetical protein
METTAQYAAHAPYNGEAGAPGQRRYGVGGTTSRNTWRAPESPFIS